MLGWPHASGAGLNQQCCGSVWRQVGVATKAPHPLQQAFVEAVLEHRKRSLRHSSHDDREPIPPGALRACTVAAAPEEGGCWSRCTCGDCIFEDGIWSCLHYSPALC